MNAAPHPGYPCPVCSHLSKQLRVCEHCGTDFTALPCCLRRDGACGRIIEVRGVTYRAHRWHLLEARRAWQERQREKEAVS